ncbi:MAG: type IV toxin-antitoxin system AbiEi family antitoxin [Coriobacteriia bacterium]|nr:type IV toxin-antitoxin system AbiEi family antitoxin [Coriobacteriia bacterium]
MPKTSIKSVEREVIYPDGMSADLVVRLSVLGRERTLLFKTSAVGQPKRAREAVDHLSRLMLAQATRDAYPVFAAPFISDVSAAICRESGVGFFDLAGNCWLSLEDVYVERISPQNPYREKRDTVALFTPKSSRVLRTLLNEPKRTWQVQQLSKTAEVSIGLVSKIKRALEEREWIATGSGVIELVEPEAMLLAWADAYSYKQNRVSEFYSLESVADAEVAVAAWCRESGVPYALTGFSGARLSSPRVRYNRASIYVPSGVDSLALNTQLKSVDSGGNVLLLKPYDEGVFSGSQTRYDLRTVSPIQLFLDVRSMAGRGEEAAEELLIRELRPSWR